MCPIYKSNGIGKNDIDIDDTDNHDIDNNDVDNNDNDDMDIDIDNNDIDNNGIDNNDIDNKDIDNNNCEEYPYIAYLPVCGLRCTWLLPLYLPYSIHEVKLSLPFSGSTIQSGGQFFCLPNGKSISPSKLFIFPFTIALYLLYTLFFNRNCVCKLSKELSFLANATIPDVA